MHDHDDHKRRSHNEHNTENDDEALMLDGDHKERYCEHN